MRILVFAAALLALPSVGFAESNFSRLNPPGPHAVGFKVVDQYDYSRSYRGATDPLTGKPLTGETARPIQTLIWYPADKGAKPVMSLADYVKLGASDDDFDHTPAEVAALEAKAIQRATGGVSPERAQRELTAPMLAHRDADPEAGKFPVVIYAPSFNAGAMENADLCEYLASQGYVVIASPSVGQSTRDMTTDLEGAETQAADIEFLIGFAHGLRQADTSHLAAMGYSWGGLSNVLAAAKDSRIKALVDLDGSVRYFPKILKQAAYATEARATAPLLFVAHAPDDFEQMPPDAPNSVTSPLNQMKYADVYLVSLAPMGHWNFNTVFGQRLLSAGDYGDYDKAELSTATAWKPTSFAFWMRT
jgi:dienelactone hydrolase